MLHSELWRPALLAVLFGAVTTGAAPAQEFINPAENAYASATPEDVADAPPKIADQLPIEIDDEALAKALSSESALSVPVKIKPVSRSDRALKAAKWNRVDNPDGSANYSVAKPIAAPWDARIGADLSTAARPPELDDPRRLPGPTPANSGSGSAWANVAVPYFATVEVRAEPANGYDKFGTKLERSVPIGKTLSVTAQSTLGVTEFRPSTPDAAAPSADAASRLFSTDNSLQLNVLATGTSLIAGTSTTTGDPVTHSRLSAAQKVYGPLNVTGSIHDPGQPTSNMSITAGMNFVW
jgi:hypothetical protein